VKGKNNMRCPFRKELAEGKMVCDCGYEHTYDIPQCPTEIFNKCQIDEKLFGSDRVKVMITIAKLRDII